MLFRRTVVYLLVTVFLFASSAAEAPSGEGFASLPTFRLLQSGPEQVFSGENPTNAGGSDSLSSDAVTVRADGSFRIYTGEITLSSVQPTGFTYFTQSREAQKELYAFFEKTTGSSASRFILSSLVLRNTHLYYFSNWYSIEAAVVSDGNVRAGLPRDFGEDGVESRLRQAFGREFKDFEIRTLGRHRYAVVRDYLTGDQPTLIYYTAVGGKLIRIDASFFSGHSAEAEAAMEEAIAALRIDAGNKRGGGGEQDVDTSAYGETLPKRKMTVMVYLPGADLESRPLQGGNASNAMTSIRSSDYSRENVNVAVFTGGAERWYSSSIPSDCNTIQVIRDNRQMAEVYRSSEQMNMGKAETLTFFLDYCVEHYPAERYALIMCDHGCGPVFGLCVDETSRYIWYKFNPIGPDRIMLDELGTALEESPFGEGMKLDFIYFGTCLTASAEVAAVCAPYADWMVSSEEPGFTLAYPYTIWEGIEDMPSGEICRRIADTFFAKAEQIDSLHHNTISVFDLRRMGTLSERMDTLFSAVRSQLNSSTYRKAAKASLGAQRIFAYPSDQSENDYDLVDLRGLVKGYASWFPTECASVLEALDSVVVYNKSTLPDETGMSVFHPNYNTAARSMYVGMYGSVPFSKEYQAYVREYSELSKGGGAVYRSDAEKEDQDVTKGSRYNLSVDAAVLDDMRDAELLILEDTGTSGIYRLISRREVTFSEDGRLETDLSHEALYAVDADGRPITDALEYSVAGDEILLRAVLEVDSSHRALSLDDVNALDLDADSAYTQNVILRCVRGEDGALIIHWIQNVFEGGMADGRTVDLKDYDRLYLVSTPRMVSRAEDGSLLTWNEWSDGGIQNYRYTIDLGDDWSLAFRDDHMAWVGRSAMLVSTDIYGVSRVLSWTDLDNPANEEIAAEPAVLCDADGCEAALEAAWRNTGSGETCLFIRWKLTNRGGESAAFIASDFAVDGVPLDLPAEYLGTVQPGQTAYAVSKITAPEADFPFASGTRISLTFETEVENGFGLWEPVEFALP